ncbi:phage terminase small subunit [Photobacterium sp. 1_MG-2023]|uniref:phage terminase small subunit n=1 Tax=Photobacterium sp. 1_MG-2023 TaxID=3062646 RepID=UPI0026E2DDB6|nr:phage terminase small subunit [Photobacterium sp. 1_MG-2023]MDO6706151.1 phage terminase small subunit [Photobacterium sp. 1_MG-2023]
MVSPLKRQRDQLLQSGTQSVAQAATVNTDSLHLRLIEFENDKKALKNFNAIADRIVHKRDVLVPKYRAVAEAYLAAGEHYENPIFTTLTLWLFDIGDLETAIAWCLKAIEMDLPTPENIKRDWPTFCADHVLEWAEREAERGHSIEPYFSQVFEKVMHGWRLHEKVSAKWFKFAGYYLLRDDEGKPRPAAVGDIDTLEKAQALLQKAHEFYDKIGVKSVLDRIPQRINALKDGKNL